MKETYLPGKLGDRIRELRTRDKLTQAELAKRISISPSTLGRIEKGEIGNTGTDILMKLAETFQVSTDFLLGITCYPDKKNYAVAQLGLTPEAIRKLLSGALDRGTVNKLLVSRYFPLLTKSISAYLNGSADEGIRVQNEIMNLAIQGLKACPDAQNAALAAKIPQGLVLERVLLRMEAMLKEMKREAIMEEGTVPTEKVVDHVEMVRQFAKQVKMNEPNMKTVTAEDVADAVLNIVAQAHEIDVQRLMSFRAPIIELLTQTGKEGNEWKTDIPTSSSAD